MRAEYLVFSLVILVVAIVISFDPRTTFITKWRAIIPAVGLYLIAFILWIIVAANSHYWFYNAQYTLAPKLYKIPIEELLYGLALPLLCLNLREILRLYIHNAINLSLEWVRVGLFALIPIGLIIYRADYEYAGLVSVLLGILAFTDRQIDTNIFLQTRTYWFIALITPFVFFLDLYLSHRPIIIYEKDYLLNFRLFSVPIENIFFRLSQILCCTILYEWRLQQSGDRTGLL